MAIAGNEKDDGGQIQNKSTNIRSQNASDPRTQTASPIGPRVSNPASGNDLARQTSMDGIWFPSLMHIDGGEPSRFRSLEDAVNEEKENGKQESQERRSSRQKGHPLEDNQKHQLSSFATSLYTIPYLVFFSFWGTLGRLGLQTITFYPGSPIIFSEIWANFGGCIVMGFLSEDRMLFREEWGTPTYHQQICQSKEKVLDEESGSPPAIDLEQAKKAHIKTKKTIPLFIGLSTGFCGCFTSFSSFIRDAFLALSNTLPSPSNPAHTIETRNGGYSFMAFMAVIVATVCICMSGLFIGSHLALALERFTPSVPFRFGRKVLDPLTVFLAFGCWLGAAILAIFPPDRDSPGNEIWRGSAVFALVFSPLGCLGRFYASLWLNKKIPSFPLGTFAANILGTAILGMSWDLQHVPLGGVIGCQVLQGIEDGFCGCLTTVSTWVGELATLRKRHAYTYGATSIVVALCFLIVIMGSMKWTIGFQELVCIK